MASQVEGQYRCPCHHLRQRLFQSWHPNQCCRRPERVLSCSGVHLAGIAGAVAVALPSPSMAMLATASLCQCMADLAGAGPQATTCVQNFCNTLLPPTCVWVEDSGTVGSAHQLAQLGYAQLTSAHLSGDQVTQRYNNGPGGCENEVFNGQSIEVVGP